MRSTAGIQYQSKVTALSTGGFVVAFSGESGGYWEETYLREFDAAGNPLDADRFVSADGGALYGYRSEPAVTALGSGDFVVAWGGYNSADGRAIFQQIFGDKRFR